MDVVDSAQNQENLVRNHEIKNMFKTVIYKCEKCHEKISPIAKIRRWCQDCYDEIQLNKLK